MVVVGQFVYFDDLPSEQIGGLVVAELMRSPFPFSRDLPLPAFLGLPWNHSICGRQFHDLINHLVIILVRSNSLTIPRIPTIQLIDLSRRQPEHPLRTTPQPLLIQALPSTLRLLPQQHLNGPALLDVPDVSLHEAGNQRQEEDEILTVFMQLLAMVAYSLAVSCDKGGVYLPLQEV